MLQHILRELGMETTIRLLVDNSAVVSITGRVGPGRMKHLDVRYLYLQQERRDRQLEVVRIAGSLNPADLLTKMVPRPRLVELCRLIGLQLNDEQEGELALIGVVAPEEPLAEEDYENEEVGPWIAVFWSVFVIGLVTIVQKICAVLRRCRHRRGVTMVPRNAPPPEVVKARQQRRNY
jgi:hypothetical protein